MTAHFELQPPGRLAAIVAATSAIGFTMASDALTGSLLRTLAASKPGGNLLEIGTGTGLSAAWLLDGMDENARLTSVDQDEQAQQVARAHLGGDLRCSFLLSEGSPRLRCRTPAGRVSGGLGTPSVRDAGATKKNPAHS